MNINILNINNIIDEISLSTLIHKERLEINQIIDLVDEVDFKIELEIEKCYLFYFGQEYENIQMSIDSNIFVPKSNSLFIENKNHKISIESLSKFNGIKLFVITDTVGYKQKSDNINTELLGKKKISNNIFILENKELITEEFCEELINWINKTEDYQIEKWESNRNVNCKYININNIKDVEIRKKFDDKIFNIINWVIKELKSEYDVDCSGDSGYCLRKIYGPTRLHKDGISIEPIDNRYIPIKKIRNMSVIICLNDDYAGGELFFPVQDFKIKLKKGHIIAFPPYWTHPHLAHTPLNGTCRYTINTWLYE